MRIQRSFENTQHTSLTNYNNYYLSIKTRRYNALYIAPSSPIYLYLCACVSSLIVVQYIGSSQKIQQIKCMIQIYIIGERER